MAVDFLSLPAEVIHNIFVKVEPTDLARLKRCCHTFNNFINSNWLIFKDILLEHFDDPRSDGDGNEREPFWEADLCNYVKAGKIIESRGGEVEQTEVILVSNAIDSLLRTASSEGKTSRNVDFLTQRFEEDAPYSRRDAIKDDLFSNKDAILYSSSLFNWAQSDSWTEVSGISPAASGHRPSWDPESQLSDASVEAEDDIPQISSSLESKNFGIGSNDDEIKAQKLSAKIHCLYGVPARDIHRSRTKAPDLRYSLRNDTATLQPYIRSRVYDLRQHTRNSGKSFWGPFLPDGSQSVDWEKVEAIMCMLNINLSSSKCPHDLLSEDSIPDWTVPFKGAHPGSYRSRPMDNIPMQPPAPLEAQDPYNISGTWMRVVCFLDYTELYDFNFGPKSRLPRPPLDAEEATRLITMRLQITDIKPPGPDDGSALPVVHFKGTSSSVRPSWDADANSQIKEQGIVRLTPQGEVRWTTWSIFHGEERWRSEGVQVGGVRSGRGVFGFWFDKDYDEHGPAGPTAFWKSHDGIAKPPPARRQRGDGLHALHVPI